MRLVLASNNAKKLAELRDLFGGVGVDLVAQGDLGIAEADEPHATFIENALAKARQAAAASGGAAIADDSGLCVDAIGGEPGVISAHYAGEVGASDSGAAGGVGVPASNAGAERETRRRVQDAANNARLLDRLRGVGDRRAQFVSTLVALRHVDDPQPLVAVGRWSGSVLESPHGDGGFGYDPLMWIAELGATVAELDAATKNRHSHRARAAAQMSVLMREVWRLG